MDSKILLENGTNELEVLEFELDKNYYGINVAKVREIIPYQAITPIPNSHPSIEGIFMPRGEIITAIDLRNCLNQKKSEQSGFFIITNFNQLNIAFHVDAVCGIHRKSWEEVIKPDSVTGGTANSVSTGIIQIEDRLVMILDFEKIVTDINPETGLKISEIDALGERKRSGVPVLIAEDSALLNKLIVDSLKKVGYENLTSTKNGQEAWDVINACREDGTLEDHVQCVITDIEMPVMDGHHLIKLIKSDERTKEIPVVIFFSLVNEEMKRKGDALGTDAQLSKPEIGKLVQIIDSFVKK